MPRQLTLALAQSILEALGSRASLHSACRHQSVLMHEVSGLTLCPLGEPKKAIGLEPQIEPWLTRVQRIPSGLLIVSESDRVERNLLSLLRACCQNGPRRQ